MSGHAQSKNRTLFHIIFQEILLKFEFFSFRREEDNTASTGRFRYRRYAERRRQGHTAVCEGTLLEL
jgi:hypothetical protein